MYFTNKRILKKRNSKALNTLRTVFEKSNILSAQQSYLSKKIKNVNVLYYWRLVLKYLLGRFRTINSIAQSC